MINVDIYVPSLDEELDFQLDETVRILQVIDEITEILLRKMREQALDHSDNFMLCSCKSQKILSHHLSLEECGVINGDKLILV